MRSLRKCCTGGGAIRNRDDDDDDAALWSTAVYRHFLGEFTMAALQSNQPMEDHSQVETSGIGTFVGVYDGHLGDLASGYVADHLLLNLLRYLKDHPEESATQALRHAYLATDEAFRREVDRTRQALPLMCARGSCCLAGFFWKGKVYVANAGDSKAVLGFVDPEAGNVATQLSEDHNASVEAIRNQLIAQHPDDPNVVIQTRGSWRVKGLIQVTRTIGNAFLKWPGYELPPSPAYVCFQLPESPLPSAILTAEPTICEHTISETDRFLIFASDGLWDHLSIHEAADIVFKNPREGIARRPVETAMGIAATKAGHDVVSVERMPRGDRRRDIHDDITVVVVFLDPAMLEMTSAPDASVDLKMSLRGCQDQYRVPSSFRDPS